MGEEERAAVKRVLNSLDRVAFLTRGERIPEALIMPWMNPMVVKAWIKLRPYVAYERARRAEPDFYALAWALGERCMAGRAAHGPGAAVKRIEDAL